MDVRDDDFDAELADIGDDRRHGLLRVGTHGFLHLRERLHGAHRVAEDRVHPVFVCLASPTCQVLEGLGVTHR